MLGDVERERLREGAVGKRQLPQIADHTLNIANELTAGIFTEAGVGTEIVKAEYQDRESQQGRRAVLAR